MLSRIAFFCISHSYYCCINWVFIYQLMLANYLCEFQNFGQLISYLMSPRSLVQSINVIYCCSSSFLASLSLSSLHLILNVLGDQHFNISNIFCLACLKFDVKELNVLPPSTTMYGSINQGKKIDMSQEQIDATNSDSNFAFPANALNTSSIIRYDN